MTWFAAAYEMCSGGEGGSSRVLAAWESTKSLVRKPTQTRETESGVLASCGPAAMGTNFPSVVVPLPSPLGQVGRAECLTRVRVRLKAGKAEARQQAELTSPGLWLGACAAWLSWLP